MSNDYTNTVRMSWGPTAQPEHDRSPNEGPTVTRATHVPERYQGAYERTQAGTLGQETQQAHGPLTRVADTSVRYVHGQQDTSSAEVVRATSSHAGTAGGSVLATLQRGAQPSVELIPGQPSTRTSIETALREGLLVRNAAGQLEDAPALQQRVADFEHQVGATETQEGPDADPAFDPRIEAMWAQEIAPLPQAAYDAAAARMVAHVAQGHGSIEGMAHALARDTGMDPAAAGELVQNGLWMHEQAAARALAPLGLAGDRLDAFYAHARTQPGPLQDAVQKLVLTRDSSGLVGMARQWAEVNEGPEVKALRAQGFEVARDPGNGGQLVRRAGGDWVPLSKLLKG